MPMGKGKHPGSNTTYKGTGYGGSVAKSGGGMSKDVEDKRELRPSGEPIKAPTGKGIFLPPKEQESPYTPGAGEEDEKYMRRAAEDLSRRTNKYNADIAKQKKGK